MNTVIHVLKKDLRRTWIPLVVWLVLLALSFVVIGSAVKPDDTELQAFYMMLSSILPLFQTLMLIVIIPLVIQEDSIVGTTAFWLTLPISRSTMLQSKLLFALVVLVLPPFVAEMIVLAANGASAHYLGLAVPEILIGHIALITVLFVCSALTSNFGRFAIFAGVLLVTAGILEFAIFWIGIFSHTQSMFGTNPDDIFSLMKSRWVVTEVLIIGIGAALIIAQYVMRRTWLSIGCAGVGLFVILIVSNSWGWDFLAPTHLAVTDSSFPERAIKVELTGNFNTVENPSVRGGTETTKNVQAQIAVTGVPDGYVVEDGEVSCDPTLANGDSLDIHEFYSNNVRYTSETSVTEFTNFPADAAALEVALGGIPILNPPSDSDHGGGDGVRGISLFEWNADTYLRYAKVPLKFSADINFVAAKYLLTAEMPVTEGTRYNYGPEHGVITSVLKEPGGMDITLRVSKFNLTFDRNNQQSPQQMVASQGDHEPKVVYLLLNRKRKEAIMEGKSDAFSLDGIQNSGRLVNRPIRLSFKPGEGNLIRVDLIPEWLADATLVRMELTPVAEFKETVISSKLILDGSNKVLVPQQ